MLSFLLEEDTEDEAAKVVAATSGVWLWLVCGSNAKLWVFIDIVKIEMPDASPGTMTSNKFSVKS